MSFELKENYKKSAGWLSFDILFFEIILIILSCGDIFKKNTNIYI